MTNPVSGAQAAGEPSLSIVLVHGAFVDGSGWQQVHSELVCRGFEVLVAQHPTTSLEGDVAVTGRLIATARHPVREHRPPTLILWGKNDPIFLPDGARAYLRDVPDTELHFFDTGHFALEDKADEMIPVLRDFLTRNLPQ